MGLTHFEGQPLVECVSEQEAMDEPRINARNTDDAPASNGGDALT
jgi:hypothetical protein